MTRQSLKELRYVPIARSAVNTVFQEVGSVAANVVRAGLGRNTIGTNLVIERFVDSLIEGSPPPVSAEEGREAVRIMEMVVARYHEKYGDYLGSQNES